ncbi:phosphoglycerate mutase-like protein 1 [Citrus sinensis]|uniref:Phosphoglycerate mutase-like protein 1 n=1 Tax=Citrus sinensis TaxID=2711 RepID=A0ACB8ICK8_CITSI|nr:phosphoglycerate mutase-like protein 1 [Citrus sinensis]
MDGVAVPSLYPLNRCKTIHLVGISLVFHFMYDVRRGFEAVIHLVRHAQGLHNVDGDKNYKAYLSPEYFDAPVTQLGWLQIENLHKHVHNSGLFKRIDLVIASPLLRYCCTCSADSLLWISCHVLVLRTLQTAVGVFGGGDYVDRMDIVPLMVANAGNSERGAISSLNSPPIIAVELCREHLIESDEDVLWKANVRETNEEVAARGLKFMNWLWTRKEKEIAIVTHRGFLNHTLNAFGNDCHPFVKKEICKHFANCELRSMVIIDRSMTGSDSSSTNYPGKIPSALDLPADIAERSHEKEDADTNSVDR